MLKPRAVGDTKGAEVLPFVEGTEKVDLQMQQLIETLTETNRHLGTIAEVGSSTLGFVRKTLPWMIAAAGVLWPAVGKVISGLPPLPT